MTGFSLLSSGGDAVTLAEMKTFLRLDHDAENDLIATLITAATRWVERATNRALLPQTWKLSANLPRRSYALSPSPVLNIVSFEIVQDNGATTTLDPATYDLDAPQTSARLVLKGTATLPTTTRGANGYVITFRAGYGETQNDIPAPLRLAVRQLVATWYEKRGDENNTGMGIPLSVLALVDSYKTRSLFPPQQECAEDA